LSPEQLKTIESRDRNLREKHLVIESSLPDQERDSVRRRRMIYRSKQRGWLEVDLLLGSYAAVHVNGMSTAELDEFEAILKEETIDTFNFVTGKAPLPPHLEMNGVMRSLQKYTLTSKITSPEAYAKIKGETNLI
jgi:succinate dehydrogenase assembly factor 2